MFEKEFDGDREKAFKNFRAWYGLRSLLLHGGDAERSKQARGYWKEIGLDPGKWRVLRGKGDAYTRKALRFLHFCNFYNNKQRECFFRNCVLTGAFPIDSWYQR